MGECIWIHSSPWSAKYVHASVIVICTNTRRCTTPQLQRVCNSKQKTLVRRKILPRVADMKQPYPTTNYSAIMHRRSFSPKQTTPSGLATYEAFYSPSFRSSTRPSPGRSVLHLCAPPKLAGSTWHRTFGPKSQKLRALQNESTTTPPPPPTYQVTIAQNTS